MAGMSCASVERRARLLFEASRVRFGKVKGQWAEIEMDAGIYSITLPAGFDDDYTLRLLMHELTHLAHPGELAAFGEFEEAIVRRVIEPVMMAYFCGPGRRRHAWWLAKLAKLREAA